MQKTLKILFLVTLDRHSNYGSLLSVSFGCDSVENPLLTVL